MTISIQGSSYPNDNVMKTGSEKLISILIADQREYFCPPIQREYKWNNEKRDAFFDDITSLRGPTDTHFMGTLILAPHEKIERQGRYRPSIIERVMIVDGQQRLTTASLLLVCALRRLSDMHPDVLEDRRELDSLRNNVKDVLGAGGHPKLVLTYADQPAYAAVLAGESEGPREVHRAVRFFGDKLKHMTTLEICALTEAVLRNLQFAVIELGQDEDPCTFFAAANGRGTPLTASELTKNLLLMKSNEGDLDKAAAQYWDPLTERFTEKEVQQFIQNVTYIHHGWLTPGRMYRVLEQDLQKLTIKPFFDNLNGWKQAFELRPVHVPKNRQRPSALVPVFRRLSLIERFLPPPGCVLWGVPLRMWTEAKISDSELIECLQTLDNFAIRVIGGYKDFVRDVVPGVGKIYCNPTLVGKDAVAAYINELVNHSSYRDRSDDQLRTYLSEMKFKRNTEERWVVAALLGLEDSKRNEGVTLDSPTLEHVAPKKWSSAAEWKGLNRATFEGHQLQLGNFTVLSQALNSDLSRGSYESKRASYLNSSLRINQELAEHLGPWDENHIVKRGALLTDQICRQWPQLIVK